MSSAESVSASAAVPRPLAITLIVAALDRAIAAIFMTWATRRSDPVAAGGEMFVVAALGTAFGVALVALALRVSGLSLRDVGWRSRAPALHAALGIGAGVALVLATAGLGQVMDATGFRDILAATLSWSGRQRALWVVIGVQAAFFEETVYRGLLQPGLMSRLGGAAGFIASVLIFAVGHLAFAPLALAGKLIYGVVLGALALWSRSLWPSAIAHAIAWSMLGFL